MCWEETFDERQQKEIEFSKLYNDIFAHGTDGHNAKIIIAKMAKMLDEIETSVDTLKNNPNLVDAFLRDISKVIG